VNVAAPVLCASFMAIVVVAFRYTVLSELSLALRLAVASLTGAALYILLTLIFARQVVVSVTRELFSVLPAPLAEFLHWLVSRREPPG